MGKRVEDVRREYLCTNMYTGLGKSAHHPAGKPVTVSAMNSPVAFPTPHPSETNKAPWILLYPVNPFTFALGVATTGLLAGNDQTRLDWANND